MSQTNVNRMLSNGEKLYDARFVIYRKAFRRALSED